MPTSVVLKLSRTPAIMPAKHQKASAVSPPKTCRKGVARSDILPTRFAAIKGPDFRHSLLQQLRRDDRSDT